MTTKGSSSRRANREDNLLWLFALTPVFSWIAAHQLNFLFSPWVCATGHRWVLYAVTGLTLLAAGAAGFASWRNLRKLRAQGQRDEEAVGARRRFMAAGGVLLAGVFVIAIIAFAIPILVHRPCD